MRTTATRISVKHSLYVFGLVLVSAALSEKTSPYGTVVGIDLGTTYSSVAVQRVLDGPVEIIPNERGHGKTPSWVYLTENGLVVGDEAKTAFPENPQLAAINPKRLLGRQLDDDLKQELSQWPFHAGSPEAVNPQDVSTAILSQLKADAEAHLGEPVTHAVIAVPPYFNAAQRQATEDAASAAGLQVLNILNDSVAAILAYDLPIECSKPYALVCDFGSSAFTATVSRLEEDGDITLLNMQTDTKWASQKIDDVIVRFLADAYGKRTEKSVSENARAMAKLKLEAEKAKIHLDTHTKAHIVIENFTRDGEDLAETLTRSKYDQISGDIVWRTLFLSELALMEANFSSTKQKMLDDVEVILVGGSSRNPRVQRLLGDYFPGKELRQNINPDEVVAYGAAKHAATFLHVSPDLDQEPSDTSEHGGSRADDPSPEDDENASAKRRSIDEFFVVLFERLDSPEDLGRKLSAEGQESIRTAAEDARRWVNANANGPLIDLMEKVADVKDLVNKVIARHDETTIHDEL